jgi:hypothetical protein
VDLEEVKNIETTKASTLSQSHHHPTHLDDAGLFNPISAAV